MKRLLLTIKYDGTAYHGWQVQQNALSVQEAFQDAVEQVFGARLAVKGCSRTDSGVHANAYCLTLDTDMNITCDGVIMALNAKLPDDIAVSACREVPDDFHPRYSCTGKQYLYKLYNGSSRDPFLRHYAYYYRRPVDVVRLNREAQAFVGTHDFAAFCSVKSDAEDTVRTVTAARVYREGELVLFEFEADGFLYNMVRIMVGTLLFINEGKIKDGELRAIIDSKDRARAGRTAQPQGLYLNKVFYQSLSE
ncbi:MAG: tRNA pseudouridine(38-40) synthase TruA [Eubacterium sp.]|nr:tRNA pseudouridine(38-40) synthase TruA [Eubacterium sp.]